MNIRTSLKRHPLLAYYVLTFAVSWGGILLNIGGLGGIPGTPEQFERMFPLVIMALLAGPSAAGLLLTGLVQGRAGFQELLSRLLKWRISARWYLTALLIAPLLMTVIPLVLSIFFPKFLPGIITTNDAPFLLVVGIASGLVGGVFEELGRTGFATPKLRLLYGNLSAGLIMGFLWGAWHFLINFWTSGTPTGALSIALLFHSLIFSIGILPAYRVLMVWVYDRTESLFVAILMHFSLTASNVILVPQAINEMTGPVWSFVIAAALWIFIAVVYIVNGGWNARLLLSRQDGDLHLK